jgi:hypothetical protein
MTARVLRPARVFDVWRRAGLADRLYLIWFVGLGLLILLWRHRVAGWPVYLLLHGVLIALVAALVLGARRFPAAHAWYPLMMPLLMFHEVAQLNFLFVDGWRDAHVLAFEAWLFPEPPTAWFGRLASRPLTEVLSLGYLSYFVLLIAVAGVLYRRPEPAPFYGVMAATVLAYLVCYVVFLAFPTEGPARTLAHLHTSPIPGGPFYALVLFVQKGGVHGNALPSAHMAGTLVPLVFAWRYVPTLAAWLSPVVVLLGVGAVYLRYHYASDVLAAIPIGWGAAQVGLRGVGVDPWRRWLRVVPPHAAGSSGG